MDLIASRNVMLRTLINGCHFGAGICCLHLHGRRVCLGIIYQAEGKRPLGRPRRRWEDNIKMDLQKVGRGCGDWMELAQDRDRWRALVSTLMNLRVPKMLGIS